MTSLCVNLIFIGSCLKDSELPTMRIIKLEEDMSKFKPENKEIEVENMRSFVNKYKVG
jgi:hypothetical protein